MPNVVSVRQTRSLPISILQISRYTLALGYVLGTINPHSGLAPLDCAHAGRTSFNRQSNNWRLKLF